MELTNKTVGITLVLVTVVSAIIAIPFLINPQDSNNPPADENRIDFTLLYNAGVMIETAGMRIYVDPINLNSSFNNLPADVILVTHPHGDHYHTTSISRIRTDDTVIVFPTNMYDAVSTYDAIGVVPGNQVKVESINITAFYMYTWAPDGYNPSHPPEANWTSYIIDINGFTFFHAGDSKNITEYEMLTGRIDVAILPIGPGCQTMYNEEVVDAIQTIQPSYFIPIHFDDGANDFFVISYSDDIEETTDCEVINLDYFTSHIFELE